MNTPTHKDWGESYRSAASHPFQPLPAIEPGIYRHYSGDHYCVIGTAIDRHGPDPERVVVVYIAPRGSYEIREINDFLAFVGVLAPGETVGSSTQRFTKVDSIAHPEPPR